MTWLPMTSSNNLAGVCSRSCCSSAVFYAAFRSRAKLFKLTMNPNSSGRRGSRDDMTPNATLQAAIKKQREACLEGMVHKRCQDLAAIKSVHATLSATIWAVTTTSCTARVSN